MLLWLMAFYEGHSTALSKPTAKANHRSGIQKAIRWLNAYHTTFYTAATAIFSTHSSDFYYVKKKYNQNKV